MGGAAEPAKNATAARPPMSAKCQCSRHKLFEPFGPPMFDVSLLLLARNLRVRAQKIRAEAESMRDPDDRQKMRDVAGGFDVHGMHGYF
jgi:hypothetical protein